MEDFPLPCLITGEWLESAKKNAVDKKAWKSPEKDYYIIWSSSATASSPTRIIIMINYKTSSSSSSSSSEKLKCWTPQGVTTGRWHCFQPPSGKSSSKVVSGGPFSVISPKTSRQHMSTPVISEKPVQSKAKPSMNPKNLWDHSSSP